MNQSKRDYIAVARGSDLVVIRVMGRGTMLTAPALAEFAEEQRRTGFKRFVFDLEHCEGLDSTFMGTMVGMHIALAGDCRSSEHTRTGVPKSDDKESVQTAISAVNITAELRKIFDMLGVDKFVKLRGSCDLGRLETTMLPEKNIAPEERHQMILKAHQNLVEIDRRNEEHFGELLKSLECELAKI